MRCNLCDKNTRCSCKGGGCPGCGGSNKQVSFTNDLLKFGLSKDAIKGRLSEIRGYLGKIDSYTAYEYLSERIDKEAFDAAMEQYAPGRKKKLPNPGAISEVENFKPTPNPSKRCVFDSLSPRARCKNCNSLAKYMAGKECPMYVGKNK